MNLNERITRQAMGIMHEAIKKEITAGKDPMGLAAAVLYMSCIDNALVVFFNLGTRAINLNWLLPRQQDN
ncbi:MAG TPA: hypothetical protein VFY64_11835 [Nitrososphaeraceae archaeon]|nr:hypothetical protein [Nitrososphaeraceae archaeon]